MLIHQGRSPENAQNLQKLVDSRPFTHQLDVIFTAAEERARLLAPLQTSYYRTKTTFSALFHDFASSSATLTALAVGSPATEDIWCLDTRGVLSLSLSKDTYERLGIGPGTRVGPPSRSSRFLVKLDLHDTTSSLAVRTRNSLKQWDIRRAEAGEDGWAVLLSSPNATRPEVGQQVQALLQTTFDAQTPLRVLPSIESDSAQEELADIFEWVGLAALGSQRLLVADTVSSYAAAYTPPSGSSTGNITHLRWTGFLSPAFVHSILKEVLVRADGLRAISALSFDAPVSYISSSGATQEGENVWTLIVSEAEVAGGGTRWVLAENSK